MFHLKSNQHLVHVHYIMAQKYMPSASPIWLRRILTFSLQVLNVRRQFNSENAVSTARFFLIL
jgi:hypothetical protein